MQSPRQPPRKLPRSGVQCRRPTCSAGVQQGQIYGNVEETRSFVCGTTINEMSNSAVNWSKRIRCSITNDTLEGFVHFHDPQAAQVYQVLWVIDCYFHRETAHLPPKSIREQNREPEKQQRSVPTVFPDISKFRMSYLHDYCSRLSIAFQISYREINGLFIISSYLGTLCCSDRSDSQNSCRENLGDLE